MNEFASNHTYNVLLIVIEFLLQFFDSVHTNMTYMYRITFRTKQRTFAIIVNHIPVLPNNLWDK